LGVNTLLIILPFYLPLMELYIKPFALTLLNKMVLLKENIVILLRLQDHSCYMSMLVSCRGEVILIATHVVNRILTSHNFGLSPFENLYGHGPDCSTLRVFGCTCFILKPLVESTKLSAKSSLCVFLGYCLSQKGYCCFDPISQKLYVPHHVVFLEHNSLFTISASSHYLTTSNVIKIDPFDIDGTILTFVPTPEPILALITNIASKVVPIDSSTMPTSIPTLKLVLAPITNIAPEVVPVDSSTTPTQSSLEVVVPLPHV